MYHPRVDNLAEYARFFGYSSSGITTGAEGLRAMACDHCGHVQIFKIDLVAQDWWPST